MHICIYAYMHICYSDNIKDCDAWLAHFQALQNVVY